MIYLDENDNILWAKGTYTISVTTGLRVYLDATVTARVTLLASDGVTEIAGETWPLAFTYIAGSQGDFVAVLRETLVVTPGTEILAHVTFDNGVDQLGDWMGRLQVMARTF